MELDMARGAVQVSVPSCPVYRKCFCQNGISVVAAGISVARCRIPGYPGPVPAAGCRAGLPGPAGPANFLLFVFFFGFSWFCS